MTVTAPAAERTLVYADYAPQPLYGVLTAPGPLTWPGKGVSDVLDYGLDCTGWLTDGGDVIDSVSVTSAPGDLTIANAGTVDGLVASVWFSGGTAGTIYLVTWTIGTAAGRVLVVQGYLQVVAVSGATVPSPAAYLTDTPGNFLTVGADGVLTQG